MVRIAAPIVISSKTILIYLMKKQKADSLKQQNEAYQVSGNDPAVHKQHKRPLSGPVVPPLGKRAKKRKLFQRMLQLNIEGLTASKIDIVGRLALEDNVTMLTRLDVVFEQSDVRVELLVL